MPPKELTAGLPPNPMVANILLMYQRIAADIKNNIRTAPSFQDGLHLMELVHRIEMFAKS